MDILSYLEARSWKKNIKRNTACIREVHINSERSLDACFDDKANGMHIGHDGEFVLYIDGKLTGFYQNEDDLIKDIPYPRILSKTYDILFKKVTHELEISRRRL